jgi:hypothetical protein
MAAEANRYSRRDPTHQVTGALFDLGARSGHRIITRRPEASGWGPACETR